MRRFIGFSGHGDAAVGGRPRPFVFGAHHIEDVADKAALLRAQMETTPPPLAGRRPGLLQLLQLFIDHRVDVVRRRTEFDLAEAEKRAHILEGLKIALDHLDDVIKIIRKAKTREEAKSSLMAKYLLSSK